MALKTRIGLGIAVIMALWVVAVLPPRSCTAIEGQPESLASMALCGGVRYAPRVTHRQSVELAEARLGRRLDQMILADSVRALARPGHGVRSADGSIVVLYDAPMTADTARAWLKLAVAELSRIPGRDIHAQVVVVLEFAPSRTVVGSAGRIRNNRFGPTTRFTSVVAGDTSCIVALEITQNWFNWGSMTATDSAGRYGQFLGMCSLVARFGLPGPAVGKMASWAFDNGRSFSPWSTAVRSPIRQRQQVIADQADYHVLSCIRTTVAACPALVGMGAVRDEDDWWYLPRMARSFLGYLAAAKASEEFSRFWRSSDEPASAMAKAFGMPHQELIREWALNSFVEVERDGLGTREYTLAAAGWLAIALVAAFAIGMRRQVSG